MSEADRLFASPQPPADFTFNEDVVRVFPDMIKRSVPGYPTIVENLGVIAARFAQPHSHLYDLGCSLGAVTQALRRHVRAEGTRVMAIDNSTAMVTRCREYLSAQDSDTLDEHRARLQAAGFTTVVPWFQCLNFTSLIALP